MSLDKIKCFYMITGQVIVGQISTYNEKLALYNVQSPATITAQPTATGKPKITFLPWPPIVEKTKNTVEIKAEHLLTQPYSPVEEVQHAYDEEFGSKLVLPNSKKILET